MADTQSAADTLELAQKHLDRASAAWDDPTDWAVLSTFGFLCLEACVVAASLHLGRNRPRSHPAKVNESCYLAAEHNLPEVEGLLIDLNNMRKHEAYGDTDAPDDLDPEEVANAIDEYVESVGRLIAS